MNILKLTIINHFYRRYGNVDIETSQWLRFSRRLRRALK
jgi:hypothetical protein